MSSSSRDFDESFMRISNPPRRCRHCRHRRGRSRRRRCRHFESPPEIIQSRAADEGFLHIAFRFLAVKLQRDI